MSGWCPHLHLNTNTNAEHTTNNAAYTDTMSTTQDDNGRMHSRSDGEGWEEINLHGDTEQENSQKRSKVYCDTSTMSRPLPAVASHAAATGQSTG
eukprot:scaffold31505_cov102-Skeletonema_marinoi.AAC.1